MYKHLMSTGMIKVMGIRLWTDIVVISIRLDTKKWLFKNMLCRFGWHHVYPSGEQYHQNSKNLMLHTYYIGCHYCDKIYFPTEYQKQMYFRIKEAHKAMMDNMLNSLT